MDVKQCNMTNCGRMAQPMLYAGQPFCEKHYMERLHADFEAEYRRWIPITQPFLKLRSLMGRMLDEVWRVDGGLLTKARLRDRAFNFKKDSRTFTFEITRHPGAIKNGYVDKRVVEKWKVDVNYGRAMLVSERDWQPGDFDGEEAGHE